MFSKCDEFFPQIQIQESESASGDAFLLILMRRRTRKSAYVNLFQCLINFRYLGEIPCTEYNTKSS